MSHTSGAVRDGPATSPRMLRVLVVDDTPDIRFLLRLALEGHQTIDCDQQVGRGLIEALVGDIQVEVIARRGRSAHSLGIGTTRQ